MKCNIYHELISAWMDNEISSFEKQELQEHLDQCPDCRAVWKSMSRLQEQIQRLAKPDVPDELWNQITMKIGFFGIRHGNENCTPLKSPFIPLSKGGMTLPLEKGGRGDFRSFNTNSVPILNSEELKIRKDKRTAKPSETIILLPTAYGRKIYEAKGESHAKIFDSPARNINKKTG